MGWPATTYAAGAVSCVVVPPVSRRIDSRRKTPLLGTTVASTEPFRSACRSRSADTGGGCPSVAPVLKRGEPSPPTSSAKLSPLGRRATITGRRRPPPPPETAPPPFRGPPP